MSTGTSVLREVLGKIIGTDRTEHLFKLLVIHPEITAAPGPQVSRAVLAQALNMLLFEDLLRRVPTAKTYADYTLGKGRQILHDHGAVRTVALEGMGGLPAGQEAITRILRPLGYALNGVYPLERLKMTGRSHAQADYPEEIAQFFLSELHPERFTPEFLSVDESVALLPVLASVFERQHTEATLADYEILLAESPEMAWISTEGNAFNHATDRVADVDHLAAELKEVGLPMKATVETLQSGRVRQTATLAARVQRKFRAADNTLVEK